MADPIVGSITPREQEVLNWLARGHTYGEIAMQLGISSETVKMHLKKIYRKLNVGNKIEALNRIGETKHSPNGEL